MNRKPMHVIDKNSSVNDEKKKKVKRRLILVVSLLSITTIILFVSLATLFHQMKKDLDREACLTPGCIHASSNIIKLMDPSADPCDDFYQFACGNYLKHTKIPEDKTVISSFTNINDMIRQQLKTILEEPLKPNEGKPYRMLKQMYNLCMDIAAIEVDGLQTVKMLIKEIGGWPVLEGESWKESEFDWKDSVYKFRKVGFSDSYFIMFNVASDSKNSSRHIIVLDQPYLGLSRELLIKGLYEKTVKAYYDYMVDIAEIFGAKKAAAEKEMRETLKFEIALANISRPKEERRNKTALYNLMTVEELQYRYPTINWLEYLNNVLDIPGIEITHEEEVVVAVPEYLTKLEDLLRGTPKRVQANYVIRREVTSMIFYLTKELGNRQQEYYKTIAGRIKRESRWKECTTLASASVHLASGSLYIRKYCNKHVKDRVEELVLGIQSEFVKMLKELDWMDEDTRKNALDKAASMTSYIGYPEELLDDNRIDNYYANVQIHSDNFLKFVTSLWLAKLNYNYKKLRKPVMDSDWIGYSYPSTANAFYSPYENSIHFPAGILQGAFFGAGRPNYMNYGSLGYIIGHEVTHGFDDQGRQFDKNGNLLNWWDDDTKNAFMKKAQCIIEQYGSYTVTEINTNINGINTQGENIADNGGIKVAYLAYNKWVENNGPELRLPGLNYSPKQLFWISAAQSRCAKTRKQVLKLNVKTGYHSPERFRVIGSFSNTENFAKDFNCSLGFKMNPAKKCQVW